MSAAPDKAFILAAGMGKRLRPYTDTLPKPLVPVAGKPTIGHIIDRLLDAGVKDITVNLHYRGDQLADYLQQRSSADLFTLNLLWEKELLDTGGGLKAGLAHFQNQPFFVVNGDAFWSEGADNVPCFTRLHQTWRDADMDLLLLLQPTERMVLTHGVGDYTLTANGICQRQKDFSGSYMFAGIRLCHPRLFVDTPDSAFSFLTLMDRAESHGRLYGLPHSGDWHHISTPEELERVDHHYRAAQMQAPHSQIAHG